MDPWRILAILFFVTTVLFAVGSIRQHEAHKESHAVLISDQHDALAAAPDRGHQENTPVLNRSERSEAQNATCENMTGVVYDRGQWPLEGPSNHITGGTMSYDLQRHRVIIPIENPTMDYVLGRSHSMKPVLDEGNEVILVPATKDNVRVGDIIFFDSRGEYNHNVVVHRVINITPEGYITKGDNNVAPDEQPVTLPQIHGVVVAIIY